MRYILDSEGYCEEVIFGNGLISCNGITCVEYIGSVPSGYNSLEEWAQDSNIRAYYLSSDTFTLDSARESLLDEQAEQEAKDNAPATKGFVSTISQVTENEFTALAEGSELMNLSNSGGGYNAPYIKITKSAETIERSGTWGRYSSSTWGIYSSCTWEDMRSGNIEIGMQIVSTTKNILPCIVSNQTISGVSISQNADRSITLNGASTANIELTLCGTANSTSMQFALYNGYDYYVSGLESLNIKLYSYDGTNRTLVDTIGNGALTVALLSKITQATLSIPSGTTLNKTIYPQIELGDSNTNYIANKRSYMNINRALIQNDAVSIYDNEAFFNGSSIGGCSGIKIYDVVMIDTSASVELKFYLANVIDSIKEMNITADRINLHGYTTIINKDAYTNTKFEVLPNDDLDYVLKISVQHLVDGENSPFITKFAVDKNGETYMNAPLHINCGSLDAIEITDNSGSCIINSTGLYTL